MTVSARFILTHHHFINTSPTLLSTHHSDSTPTLPSPTSLVHTPTAPIPMHSVNYLPPPSPTPLPMPNDLVVDDSSAVSWKQTTLVKPHFGGPDVTSSLSRTPLCRLLLGRLPLPFRHLQPGGVKRGNWGCINMIHLL